jgi:hypothetical protein
MDGLATAETMGGPLSCLWLYCPKEFDMLVPLHFARSIIGSDGASLSDMENRSGAEIRIVPPQPHIGAYESNPGRSRFERRPYDDWGVRARGRPAQVAHAGKLLKVVLKKAMDELVKGPVVPIGCGIGRVVSKTSKPFHSRSRVYMLSTIELGNLLKVRLTPNSPLFTPLSL